MSDAFLLTENSHKVAVQLADRWATAVEAQASRIHHPESLRVTVVDQWLQVIALRQVLVAAEMARKHAPGDKQRHEINTGITSFLEALVITHDHDLNQRDALLLARHVLEHFDEYWCGTGHKQSDALTRNPKLTREELAVRYRPDFGATTDSLPTLRVGDPYPSQPLVEVDLASVAPAAARQLVRALAAILGVDVLHGFGSAPLTRAAVPPTVDATTGVSAGSRP